MIGVVTGVREEAACLAGVDALIVCSGANAGRAHDLALRLVEAGADRLVSFGLAGGLAPWLKPGALLLPEMVIGENGARYTPDPDWRRRVRAAIGHAVHEGAITASDKVVAKPDAKHVLAFTSGAEAVDMESLAVAEVAATARLPFLVLRAVADPWNRTIPPPALAGVLADGRVSAARVAWALARAPWHLPALLRLARHSAAGLAALKGVAGALDQAPGPAL